MAEEYQGQEKTEEPTPRKREKAREEGQVARSKELVTMVMLVGGSVGLMLFGGAMPELMESLTRKVFELAVAPDGRLGEALLLALEAGLTAVVPILLFVFVAAVVASGAVGGFVLAPKSMAFKGNRLSPLSGFKRMFSSKALVELGKAIGKFLIVAGVAFSVLGLVADDLLTIGFRPLERAMADGLGVVLWTFLLLAVSLVIIAAIDVPFQLAQSKKQIRMTRQEVKDELKDSEGRPEVRGRIRQAQQDMARRRMFADIPDADVVITNPEHYSVALKYQADAMGAPKVIAKGADLIALRIREIAGAHDVAIVESPPLTRAVFYACEIGEEVPAALYVAVAQILAYVYQLKQYERGSGPVPKSLNEPVIPEEFRRDT